MKLAMEMEVLEDGGGWLMMERSGVEWRRRRKWTIYIHEISGEVQLLWFKGSID